MQKKNVFNEDRTIKVSWAKPWTDPDEKLKGSFYILFIVSDVNVLVSVCAVTTLCGFQLSCLLKWIERVVLACKMQTAKRKSLWVYERGYCVY